MPTITISNLRPAGSELFDDSESFLKDLRDAELNLTHGGCQHGRSAPSPFNPFTVFPWTVIIIIKPFPGDIVIA
jgi:hypothetical protein